MAWNSHVLDLLNGIMPVTAPEASSAPMILLDALRSKLLASPSESDDLVSSVSVMSFLLELLAQLEAMSYLAPMVLNTVISFNFCECLEMVLEILWAQMQLLCWDIRHPSQAYRGLKMFHHQVVRSYSVQLVRGLADDAQDLAALDASSTLCREIAVSSLQNRNWVALARWIACAYCGLEEL